MLEAILKGQNRTGLIDVCSLRSPSGTLRISIQATWLRHSSPDNDAMTEISGMSLGKSMQSSVEDQVISMCLLLIRGI